MNLVLNPETGPSGTRLFRALVRPIQDAIDLARFLVETRIGVVRFAVFLPKSVGGAVEIAAITEYEGFRSVQRKTFYPAGVNGRH